MRGDLSKGRVLVEAARQPRHADHADAMSKARNAGDGIVEFDGLRSLSLTTIAAIFKWRVASTSSAVRVWLMVPR